MKKKRVCLELGKLVLLEFKSVKSKIYSLEDV